MKESPFQLVVDKKMSLSLLLRLLLNYSIDGNGRYVGRHTVDISVDVSTEYRSIVGRVSGECRSSIGRYIGDVSTDHWITFGREIDRQSLAIASAECQQFIGEPSVKYR